MAWVRQLNITAQMDAQRVRAVLKRSCWSKKPYRSATEARAAAEGKRAEGHAISAYRCSLAGGAHWHIGHVLGVRALVEYAAAVRWCYENGTPSKAARPRGTAGASTSPHRGA